MIGDVEREYLEVYAQWSDAEVRRLTLGLEYRAATEEVTRLWSTLSELAEKLPADARARMSRLQFGSPISR